MTNTSALQVQREVERFLRGIVPPAVGNLYIAVVEVPPEEHPYPGLTSGGWQNLQQYYLPVLEGQRIDQIPDTTSRQRSEWYFTPALFNRPNTRQKEYCVGAATLWVDIDDPKALDDPLQLTPKPSAVVETSPGKYHIYWFLEETLSVDLLESYNRRLAYSIPGGDHGGWDANQLLRIPTGTNAKTGTTPRLIHWDPRLRYELDAFTELEDPTDQQASPDTPPTPTGYIAGEVVLERLKTQGIHLSEEALTLLRQRDQDRSRALWRLYHLLHQAGISQEDAFWLILDSPNDKFAKSRHHRDELWKDLTSGYADAKAHRVPQSILEQIKSVSLKKLPAKEKYNEIGALITQDMLSRGILYSDITNENRYLDTETGESRLVSKYDEDFQQYILRTYGINAAHEEFKYVYTHLMATCRENGPYQTWGTSYFDRDTARLYVNRYDNYVYVLDGHTVDARINGTDNVYFREVPWAPPFKYIPREQRPPMSRELFDTKIMNANIPPQGGVSAAAVKTVIRAWLYAIFFSTIMPVRPILFFHGEPGAGKTSILMGIGQLFEGPSYSPLSVPDKEQDFEFQVRNRDWVFYDNVDSPSKWLPDALARLATRFTIQARKLYTDNTQLRYPVRCFAALTAHSPKFRREDVVDRLVPVRVEPFEKFRDQDDIDFGIETNRNLIWSELLDDLNRIVLQYREQGGLPAKTYPFRLADFARFLEIVAPMYGQTVDELLNLLQYNQATEATEEDELIGLLKKWLAKDDNRNRPVSASTLQVELSALPGGSHLLTNYSERGFATKLGRQVKYINHFVKMEKVKEGTYAFDFLSEDEGE